MRRARYAPVILKRSIAACAATGLLGCAAYTTVRAQAVPRPATLQSIRVMPSADAGSTTVILEADGPLPEPEADSLAGPARVFLDLKGVLAASTVTRTGRDPLILRARVARHSDVPLITRVVFDLSRVSRFHIDASARGTGRLVVTLGGSGSAAAPSAPRRPVARAELSAVAAPIAAPVQTEPRSKLSAAGTAPPASAQRAGGAKPPSQAGATPPPPVQPAPPLAASSTTLPSPTQTPDLEKPAARLRTPRLRQNAGREPSAAQVEAYTAQIWSLIRRLQELRPLLLAIDRRDEITADLNAAAAEFDAIGRILMAIKPIPSREATHGLLQRACVLGARASRTLQEATRNGDAAGEWNAASAAAGALILLDRAIGEIG